MTAGGCSSLVIGRDELLRSKGYTPEQRARTERAIRDGFAWLARSLPPGGAAPSAEALPPGPAGPESAWDDFHFLYGLERACILGGVRRLADSDRYALGAERILERQREDGSFLSRSRSNGNGRVLVDTCFALLFLKRALFRIPADVVTPPSAPVPPR